MLGRSTTFRKFDLFINKDKTRTELVGPYWLSLVRVYGIQVSDIIHFEYKEDEKLFEMTVYNSQGDEKEAVADSGKQASCTLLFQL